MTDSNVSAEQVHPGNVAEEEEISSEPLSFQDLPQDVRRTILFDACGDRRFKTYIGDREMLRMSKVWPLYPPPPPALLVLGSTVQ
jgi:hypothetical protein